MSKNETFERNTNKRRQENDDDGDREEDEVWSPPCKREKISVQPEDDSQVNSSSGMNHTSRKGIEEAIRALDMIQYELNMGNIPDDSPDPSDHDTPPESEDESEDVMDEAHALGFAACIRETFRFLDSCGIPENDPIYKQLKTRFIETNN